jgi:tricorn protease
MAPDGTGPVRLTTNSVYDGEPVRSPDGHSIAFASNRSGHGDIYTMNADSSGPRLARGAHDRRRVPSAGRSSEREGARR